METSTHSRPLAFRAKKTITLATTRLKTQSNINSSNSIRPPLRQTPEKSGPKSPDIRRSLYEMGEVPTQWISVCDSEKSGQGVFAVRDIPRGTRVLAEPILISIRHSRNLLDVHYALEDLSEQQRAQYLDLHAQWSNDRASKRRTEDEERLRTLETHHADGDGESEAAENDEGGGDGDEHDENGESETSADGGEINCMGEKVQKVEDWLERFTISLEASHPNTTFSVVEFQNNILNAFHAHSIYDTNSFEITKAGDIEQTRYTASAVFGPLTSRVNHACVPNVYQSFNPRTEFMTMHALEDIPAGTQLVASYMGEHYLGKSRIERQRHLKSNWGFNCACRACEPVALDHNNRDASDERRLTIMALGEEMHTWRDYRVYSAIKGPEEALEVLQELLAVLKDEGYAGPELTTLYLDAVKCCASLERGEEAAKWAVRALQTDLVCVGEDGEEYQETMRVLKGLCARDVEIAGPKVDLTLRDHIERRARSETGRALMQQE